MTYHHLGSTVRANAVQETLARIEPLCLQMGVTRVANVTGLDNIGIPVAVSIRPNAKHLSTSQGKGASWELAKISALMESIEGYHVENPPAPQLIGSFDELHARYPLINPGIFDAANFEKSNLTQTSMAWIACQDLLTQQQVYIPHSLICIDSSQPHPEYAWFSVSTNGLAAGNSYDEALCHALYELIERDALYRWYHLDGEQQAGRQIDLQTIDSCLLQKILQQYRDANITVQVWEITSTLQVPAYLCMISDDNLLRGLQLFSGSGAHLDRDIALSRALLEAAQSRLTMISGSRDDVYPEYYQQPPLEQLPLVNSACKSYQQTTASVSHHCFKQDGDYLLSKLANFPHIFVVDLSCESIAIPVVKVIIPGLLFSRACV